MKKYILLALIMIIIIAISGCGGGSSNVTGINTGIGNNTSNNPVIPDTVSGGTGSFKVTVEVPGKIAEDINASVIPWQSKYLRVEITGTNIVATIIRTLAISAAGTHILDITGVPAGNDLASIQIWDKDPGTSQNPTPTAHLLAQRKHGFFLQGGDSAGTGSLSMGIAVDSSGNCNPPDIDISTGTTLYFENQDSNNDHTVTLNPGFITIGPISRVQSEIPPAQPAVYSSLPYTFNTAGIYTYGGNGSGGTGRILVFSPPSAPQMVSITGTGVGAGDIPFNMGQTGNSILMHQVELSNFYIGKYEVTDGEYSKFDPTRPNDNLPVVNVSWYDAVKYCNWLSVNLGYQPCYSDSDNDGKLDTMDRTKNGFRLPTEVEWEYACRAGTITDYYWGNTLNQGTGLNRCWYGYGSGGTCTTGMPASVGYGGEHPWGLFDMSGNVWEWCNDWYATPPPPGPLTDYTGPGSGSYRVYRGGGWDYAADGCRTEFRGGYNSPVGYGSRLGFRLARTNINTYSAPSIYWFSPGSGPVGTTVTIGGSFNANPANNIVRFNGSIFAPFISCSSSQITVLVPTGATPGKITVRTPGGTAYSANNFLFPPVVNSFTDPCGAGQVIDFYGLNFGDSGSRFLQCHVKYWVIDGYSQWGGYYGHYEYYDSGFSYTEWTDTHIRATLPSGNPSKCEGNITIFAPGGNITVYSHGE